MSELGRCGLLKSVFPPDSIPSWITIYTGLPPDEHGVVQSIDYLKKDYRNFSISTNAFQGRTFWDEAGRAGKRVCVINPFMAYPVWKVNGVMVNGPVFVSGEIQSYPPGILTSRSDIPPLGGIVDFPTRKTLKHFVSKTTEDTRHLARFALDLYRSEPWDLFFVSFLTLDRLQHFLWRFCDEDDPTYPGRTEYERAILDLYRELDGIIGEFLKEIRDGHSLLVISDHGHGRRCTSSLNVNEFLRRRGYLKTGIGRAFFLNKNYWIEKLKNNVLQLLFTLKMEEYAYYIGRMLGNPKRYKTSEFVIRKDDSMARLSGFAGMGPFGGIEINEALRTEGGLYEAARDSILRDMRELSRVLDGDIFRWIEKREVIFTGEKKDIYPDILFELKENFGVNWSLYVPLITRNPFHRRISGGHTMNGVIASNSSNLWDSSQCSSVAQVKAIILRTLDVPPGH
jgi:predicted AlkP superfamily phosphohydrolase/phosphomutase